MRTTTTRTVILLGLVLAAAALAWQAQKIELPPPFATESVRNNPRVIGQPDGAQLQLPPGFNIEVVADGFRRPRIMVLGPSGELLLTDFVQNGSVVLLRDTNGDHKYDNRKALIEGLDRPFGLAFWQDYLYVGETTSLKRYRYNKEAMTAGPGEVVHAMPDFGQGHSSRTVLFNRAGDKMYLAVGSRSNVDGGEPPERAAILRFNPDGSGKEIYASGTRNPIGLRLYPGTDTLWAAVQERDLLGDDLVPDYVTHIQQGGFYGWPFAYIGPNEDPRRKGENPGLVAKTIVPDVPVQSHSAVIDLWFYTGTQFPQKYRNGAFVAYHGSWNRAKRTGYKVAFIPFQNQKPSGPPEDFLTGWMLSPDQVEVWGRPTGFVQLPDGSLLLTDDGGNKIWRITYSG